MIKIRKVIGVNKECMKYPANVRKYICWENGKIKFTERGRKIMAKLSPDQVLND